MINSKAPPPPAAIGMIGSPDDDEDDVSVDDEPVFVLTVLAHVLPVNPEGHSQRKASPDA